MDVLRSERFFLQVMADVRDFHEDWKLKVPTVPVLLKSVFRTRLLLTAVHGMTLLAFWKNIYITIGTLFATVLVWTLDENSPRNYYRLSFHSQTLTIVLYGIVVSLKSV